MNGYLDACEACGLRDVAPADTVHAGPSTVAVYACGCGHTWETSFWTGAYVPLPGQEVAS